MKTFFAFLFLALAASVQAATHRRTGTELFRVQPAREVMPSRSSEFETFDSDAQA